MFSFGNMPVQAYAYSSRGAHITLGGTPYLTVLTQQDTSTFAHTFSAAYGIAACQ